jgi:hypothetical protein
MPGQSVLGWSPSVRVVKATQDGRRCDFRDVSIRYWPRARVDLVRNMLPRPLMRPEVIVEVDVFLHHPVKLSLMQNKDVVQALSLQAPYEPLANGI